MGRVTIVHVHGGSALPAAGGHNPLSLQSSPIANAMRSFFKLRSLQPALPREGTPPREHVLAIIQARMGSRRLPGKVLRQVLGKPLLGHMLERVTQAESLDKVVVATSDQAGDDPLAEYCQERGVPCFRGSEHDVLQRYAEAAGTFSAETIVRLTADNPLLDPKVIDLVVGYFTTHAPQFDYVSNTQDRSFPRGMDVEVFSAEALERADREAKGAYDREHVTPYLYAHPDRFKVGRIELRLTVDTEEDLELVERVLKAGQGRTLQLADVVALLQENPEWVSINGHLIQE